MRVVRGILLALTGLLCLGGPALAQYDPGEQAERWESVRTAVFQDRKVTDAGDAFDLVVPKSSFDAWLVPVEIFLNPDRHFVALWLTVDANPSPLVGVFHFGPAFVPGRMKLNVRVDNPTLVHAVAEMDDGRLLMAARFISAAGGCAAPVTGQAADLVRLIGRMEFRRTRPLEGDEIVSQLLINHPNFNGMQTGENHLTIPARYLEDIAVRTGGVTVFDFESGISLSMDPTIGFTYRPKGNGGVVVTARESTGTVFTRHYEPLAN